MEIQKMQRLQTGTIPQILVIQGESARYPREFLKTTSFDCGTYTFSDSIMFQSNVNLLSEKTAV